MRQAILRQDQQVLRGWIPNHGTNGREVVLGSHVDIPERGTWIVEQLFHYSLDKQEVKKMADRARGSFTALKAYR